MAGLGRTVPLASHIFLGSDKDDYTVESVELVLSAWAALLLLLYVSKAFLAPAAFKEDLSKISTASPFGAALMSASMLCARIAKHPFNSTKVARLGVYLTLGIQVLAVVPFLALAFRTKKLPEPNWNPVLVAVGIAAITGGECDVDARVLQSSLWAGVAVLVVTNPFITYNVFSERVEVQNASIFILQASASFCCVGWWSLQRYITLQPGWVGEVLFGLSSTWFILTIIAAVQRRRILYALLVGPFAPGLAAVTFPSISTATAALLVYEEYEHPVFLAYCGIVYAVVCTTVLVLNVSFIAALPRILMQNPNPRSTCIEAIPAGFGSPRSSPTKRSSEPNPSPNNPG